jgi:uncharacterized membrane protein
MIPIKIYFIKYTLLIIGVWLLWIILVIVLWIMASKNESLDNYFSENKSFLYSQISKYEHKEVTDLNMMMSYWKFIDITPWLGIKLKNECGVIDMFVYSKDFFKNVEKGSEIDWDRYFRVLEVFDDNFGILQCTDYICWWESDSFCIINPFG